MNLKIIYPLFTLGALGAALFLAAGCGAKAGVNGEGGSLSSESLTYQYSVNGCDTGEHSFSSTDDLCNGLQNESLNHGCAGSLRYDTFQKSCPGRTWNPR